MLSEINSDIINTIIQGETIEEMKRIADGSVDMILADLPYGTTACKWDTVIPFEPLWAEYERVIKPNGAIVLTASQPFTSALIMSNVRAFKHAWVWDKVTARGHLVAKYRPMQQTEDIIVFAKGGKRVNYYPIMIDRPAHKVEIRKTREYGRTEIMGGSKEVLTTKVYDQWYPKNVITMSNANSSNTSRHPTQKPVALFEYLIRTYTNEGELVLDNVIGSGTTAVAAINTGRQFIGIEREEEYVNIARERVEQAYAERAKTEVMSND